jgi:hypothetical protein
MVAEQGIAAIYHANQRIERYFTFVGISRDRTFPIQHFVKSFAG